MLSLKPAAVCPAAAASLAASTVLYCLTHGVAAQQFWSAVGTMFLHRVMLLLAVAISRYSITVSARNRELAESLRQKTGEFEDALESLRLYVLTGGSAAASEHEATFSEFLRLAREAEEATTLTAPENPTLAGYTILGWGPVFPQTMPTGGLAPTVTWKINKYTISFDSDGGSAVGDITEDYGTTLTTPRDPTLTGHTFLGWDPAFPQTMPGEDMEPKAKWTAKRYAYSIVYYYGGARTRRNPHRCSRPCPSRPHRKPPPRRN